MFNLSERNDYVRSLGDDDLTHHRVIDAVERVQSRTEWITHVRDSRIRRCVFDDMSRFNMRAYSIVRLVQAFLDTGPDTRMRSLEQIQLPAELAVRNRYL
jgi:hypothetical protein